MSTNNKDNLEIEMRKSALSDQPETNQSEPKVY